MLRSKNKKIIYLMLFIAMLGFNNVSACNPSIEICTEVPGDPTISKDNEDYEDKKWGSHLNNGKAEQHGNYLGNAYKIDFKDEHGNILKTINVSSSESYKPTADTIVIPGLTNNSAIAGEVIKNYLLNNNAQIIRDAYNQFPNMDYGTVEQWHQYYISGTIAWETDKNAILNGYTVNGVQVSNKTALRQHLLELMPDLELGTLGHLVDITREMCASWLGQGGGTMVGSSAVGCGYNVFDLLDMIKCRRNPPTGGPQVCPNGTMRLSNPSPSCYKKLGGIVAEYKYTAGNGTQANVHISYGQDQNAPGTGAFCKLFCNEYGIATLPGGVESAIQLGSYMIWPTSNTNFTNAFVPSNYPLKFKGTKACKLVVMPDNGNFPGTGCITDPLYDYSCLYDGNLSGITKPATVISTVECSNDNSVKGVGNKGDNVDGTTYETIRQAKDRVNATEANCGTYMRQSGNATNGSDCTFAKYTVDANSSQYYNSNKYSLYKDAVNKINEAADRTANACRAYKDVKDHCDEPDVVIGTNYYGPITGPSAAKRDCISKRSAYNAAQSSYNNAKANVENKFHRSIDTCKSYIEKYNAARQILLEIGMCGNFSVGNANDYYNFQSNASYAYKNDGSKYESSGALASENSANVNCSGDCGGLGFEETKANYPTLLSLDLPTKLKSKISQIQGRDIKLVTDEVVYKSTAQYSYIDKTKNEYVKIKPSKNYLELKNQDGDLVKVLPTDYSNKILDSTGKFRQDSYKLSITSASFGENSKFTISNYICDYEVSKGIPIPPCPCPENSDHPGLDLMDHVTNDPISCADAQEKYCYDNGDNPPGGPSGGGGGGDQLYCPDGTSMAPCLKTGIGYEACLELCDGEYKCKNTNGLRTGMDITDCVRIERTQGLTLQQALDYCDSVVCPIGKTIIYRTIRLENPFPSIDADNIVTQRNLRVGKFNNDIKGRYPGTNWNGELTVKNKIRNNRGTSGTSIYQNKEPLYTFVLNGVTIKNIRDYNDRQRNGYNDFTLECKKNNSAGCISYVFVHNASLSGLTGGTCRNISLDNGFYTCDD